MLENKRGNNVKNGCTGEHDTEIGRRSQSGRFPSRCRRAGSRIIRIENSDAARVVKAAGAKQVPAMPLTMVGQWENDALSKRAGASGRLCSAKKYFSGGTYPCHAIQTSSSVASILRTIRFKRHADLRKPHQPPRRKQ
nr:hypothetical protein [uncultured Noviherbaspirillum sp.]